LFIPDFSQCSEAWVICWHKDSPSPLENLIDRFGKLPVLTRQWVRHIIALPDPAGGHAYNWNGNIAMFNVVDDMDVFVHESGHSLDLLGAYADNPLSSPFPSRLFAPPSSSFSFSLSPSLPS
jgi:hypothetical protein